MLVERTKLCWALDRLSDEIVRRCYDRLPLDRRALTKPIHSDSDGGFRGALQDVAAHTKRSDMVEPEVFLIAVSFLCDAEQIDKCIEEADRTLRETFARDCRITLVCLLPPALASSEDKAAAYDLFCELEKMAGERPSWRHNLINELPLDVYQNAEEAQKGFDELHASLTYALFDQTLHPRMYEIGDGIYATDVRVKNRKCIYLSIGGYTLFTPNEIVWRHAAGRFVADIHAAALADSIEVSEQENAALDAMVAAFSREKLALLQQHLPKIPELGQQEIFQLEDPASGRESGLLAIRKTVSDMVKELEPLQDVLTDCTHRQLLTILSDVKRGFPSANAFLQKLTEETLLHMRLTFCLDALMESIRSELHAIKLEVADNASEEEIREAIKKVKAESQKVERIDESIGDTLRSIERMMGLIADLGVTHADELLENEYHLASERIQTIKNDIIEVDAELEEAKDTLVGIEAKASLMDRMLRREDYINTKTRAEERIGVLQRRRGGLHQSFQNLCSQYIRLTIHILLPHRLRAEAFTVLSSDVARETERFESYVDELSAGVKATWGSVSRLPDLDNATQESVFTASVIDMLYSEIYTQHTPMEHLKKVLQYVRPDVSDATDQEPFYRQFKDLSDHYEAEPSWLVERLRDYAEETFGYFLNVSVCQVLEKAERLDETIERAMRVSQEPISIRPGPRPIVESSKKLSFNTVIRTDTEQTKTVTDALNRLVTIKPSVVDKGNFDKVEVLSVISGLPAFLIHAIEAGREKRLKDNATLPFDLWPQEE